MGGRYYRERSGYCTREIKTNLLACKLSILVASENNLQLEFILVASQKTLQLEFILMASENNLLRNAPCESRILWHPSGCIPARAASAP